VKKSLRRKLAFALARLREPSTWAAVSALCGFVGLPDSFTLAAGALLDVAPRLIDAAAVVAAAGAAMLLSERGAG